MPTCWAHHFRWRQISGLTSRLRPWLGNQRGVRAPSFQGRFKGASWQPFCCWKRVTVPPSTTWLQRKLDELERDRTQGSRSKLRYGGCWLGVPVLFALMILLMKSEHGRHFFDTAGAGLLWLAFVSVATLFALGCGVYQRRVPIKRQLTVDLIAWSVFVWMYFHFRPWNP
jgi:hypothetical protein